MIYVKSKYIAVSMYLYIVCVGVCIKCIYIYMHVYITHLRAKNGGPASQAAFCWAAVVHAVSPDVYEQRRICGICSRSPKVGP